MDKSLGLSSSRGYTFALIDPTVVESLPTGIETQSLVPRRLYRSGHLMPVLLDLRLLSSEGSQSFSVWLEDAVKQLQEPPISFLITTHTSADEFSRHWNAMQLVQASPTRKFWLRMHDPRVMHQLLRVLNPAQRRRLFGRAEIFHYRLGGSWISAQRDQGQMADLQGATGSSSRWDWHRIERIGIVNRALIGAGISGALESTNLGYVAEQLIERAIKRYGLTEKEDLVEFATRGLQAPLFDEHPLVALAIRKPLEAEERTNLADRFALIEGHVWDALRHSANSSIRPQV